MHIGNFFHVEAINITRVLVSGNAPKQNLRKLRKPQIQNGRRVISITR